MNEIDRWILFMKENPTTWKSVHSKFINAQFEKHRAFVDRLRKTPEGRKKLEIIFKKK